METTQVHEDLIGKTYHEIVNHLKIDSDGGDCCGYASCDIIDLPPHTDVDSLILKGVVQIDYPAESDYASSTRSVLNFIFNDKDDGQVILGYDLRAGSGSGWAYGAYVSLKLDDRELLEVSW